MTLPRFTDNLLAEKRKPQRVGLRSLVSVTSALGGTTFVAANAFVPFETHQLFR